jgi:hypothetical protein
VPAAAVLPAAAMRTTRMGGLPVTSGYGFGVVGVGLLLLLAGLMLLSAGRRRRRVVV